MPVSKVSPVAASPLPVPDGGTGAATLLVNGLLVGEGVAAVNSISAGTAGQPLLSSGAAVDPNWGTLGANYGGTGQVTLGANGILIGEGTSAIASMSAGTAGQIVQSSGAAVDPAWSTATYPGTCTQGDVVYASANNVVDVLAKDTNATRSLTNTGANNSPAWAQVALTTGVTGILPVANGGTGANTLAIHGVMIGNTTSAVNVTAAGTAGQPLMSGGAGADPNWGTLGVNYGGTGDTSIPAYNVVIGAGTSALTWAAPGAAGIPLVSAGAAVNPAFGTATVPGGGTGTTTLTDHGVLLGHGTGSVGATAVGTAGQVLTSNGAGNDPTWQAGGGGSGFTKVVRQVFTSNGTYTPTVNMLYCDIEVVGAGGGGAGEVASGISSGGGGGGYARKVFTAAAIGASQAVTIGVGGAGGVGAFFGTAGGTSSVGALISATGGGGGTSRTAAGHVSAAAGGTGAGGDFNVTGTPGGISAYGGATYLATGPGGSSFFGGGGAAIIGVSDVSDGNNGTSYGGGGGSALGGVNNGGTGANGVVIVTEYCS
jgi:hypothetical protein